MLAGRHRTCVAAHIRNTAERPVFEPPVCVPRSRRTPRRSRDPPSRVVGDSSIGAASEGEKDGTEFIPSETATEGVAAWWTSPHDSEILRFAAPTLLASLILPFNGIVDTAVLGRLGTAQLSAVGVGGAVVHLFVSCVSFLPFLVTPYVARRAAENQPEKVSEYACRCLWFAVLAGSFVATCVFANSHAITQLLRPAVEVRPLAVEYLRTAAVLIPLDAAYLCAAGVLRGLKNPDFIVVAALLDCAVNAALDLFFVFGCGWSVAGVAAASVVAHGSALAMILYKLVADERLSKRHLLRIPALSSFLPILREGVRLSLRSVILVSMLAMGSFFIAEKGALIHATYELIRQVTFVTLMASKTLEQTVQALTASCLGAEDLKSAREVIVRVMQLSFVVVTSAVMLLCGCSQGVARVFTTNPEVISTFTRILPVVLFFMPLSAVVFVAEGALIGAGHTRIVASYQTASYTLAIAALVALRRFDALSPVVALLTIRVATLLHGCVTIPFLFSAKRSPYAFSLLP